MVPRLQPSRGEGCREMDGGGGHMVCGAGGQALMDPRDGETGRGERETEDVSRVSGGPLGPRPLLSREMCHHGEWMWKALDWSGFIYSGGWFFSSLESGPLCWDDHGRQT